MKKYSNPVVEIRELEPIDVICTSGNGLIEGGENGEVGDIIIPKPLSSGDFFEK